jgi:cytochrome c
MGMLVTATGLLTACFLSPVLAEDESSGAYLLPFADPEKGRQLFVGKGCVVCHSVNGVGGQVGPALDGNASRPYIDPFDMAARMWRGAPTMLLLQEMALGYQIDLTGQELAHIARFLQDLEAQKSFSSDDIPQRIRDLMVDKIYEELENDETAQ